MVCVLSKQINKQLDSSLSRDVHINANTDQRLTLYFIPGGGTEGEKNQNCGSLGNKPKVLEWYCPSPRSMVILGNTMAEN